MATIVLFFATALISAGIGGAIGFLVGCDTAQKEEAARLKRKRDWEKRLGRNS